MSHDTMETHPGAIAAPTADRAAAPPGTLAFFVLSWVITWILAIPTALAWLRHETPPPFALACAGLSAFGPLIATLAVTVRRQRLGEVFGRWRTNPSWVVLSLAAPFLIHALATGVYAALGGQPAKWFHPPVQPEQLAALVVFPLGEEFGWRGFAHPRMVQRYGMVRGTLLLGAGWGLWHLAYSVTPKGGFDPFLFGLTMLELPLYSLLIAWVFERANRSMAVAIAFHAGAHLDHIELSPQTEVGLHVLHILVVAVLAVAAARSLARAEASR